MNINPLDQEFTDKIKDIDTRLQNIERSRQPFLSDWFEFNISGFSLGGGRRIDITNYDPEAIFQVGDKVKLTQSTVKYFYIIEVGTDYIEVDGGSDYVLTALPAITTFAISRKVNPSGHPIRFAYISNIEQYRTSRILLGVSNLVAFYSMNGDTVLTEVSFNATVTGVSTYVYIGLPFPLVSGRSVAEQVSIQRGIFNGGTTPDELFTKGILGTNPSTFLPVVNEPGIDEVCIAHPNETTGLGNGTSLNIDLSISITYNY